MNDQIKLEQFRIENKRLQEEIKRLAERIKELEESLKEQLPTTIIICPVCNIYGMKINQKMCDKCKIKKLEETIKWLRKINEYARHAEGCNRNPWDNECSCGYLQVLKGK